MAKPVAKILNSAPLLGLLWSLPASSQTWQEYSLPAGSQPAGVTAGPDGAVWVTEYGTGKILRIGLFLAMVPAP